MRPGVPGRGPLFFVRVELVAVRGFAADAARGRRSPLWVRDAFLDERAADPAPALAAVVFFDAGRVVARRGFAFSGSCNSLT